MGRKSKREHPAAKVTCFYCTRQFDTESTLLLHQKSIHFKCPLCPRRFSSAPAMGLHMTTVHHETLKAVPKAEFGRDDPTINIQGTKNAPLFDDEQIKRMREAAQHGQAKQALPQADPATASAATAAAPVPFNGLVYSDDAVSPEEKRAMLDKYKYDPAAVKQKLSALDASIADRLKAALAQRAAALMPAAPVSAPEGPEAGEVV